MRGSTLQSGVFRGTLLAALSLVLSPPAFSYVGPGAGFAFLSSFLVLVIAFFMALISILSWPFRFLLLMLRGRRANHGGAIDRLVIIGLDGFDPSLAEKFMAEGKLPNFSRLRDQGAYSRLQTTTPAISPVAWSSFATGTNPSKHNIFDFLSRDCRSYLPQLSSAQVGKPARTLSIGRFELPLSKPVIRGMRKSVPFWKILGERGIHSSILRIPITFPPEKFNGHLLSGMCAPDLKGSQGTFSLYSSDPARENVIEGGTVIPVGVCNEKIETQICGPENALLKKPGEMRLPMVIAIDAREDKATVCFDGRKLELKKGELSPWVRLTFRPGLGMRVKCICRFYISMIQPHFEMYLTPLNIDPDRPALPISHPFYYSIYLSKLLGSYVTLGLANDTWALNEGALSEAAFLELAYSNHDEWERMLFSALEKVRRGVVACHFETTDSIQHMFFRYLDPKHPALTAGPAHMSAQVIEDLYKKMDAMLGRVMGKLPERSILLVMSDHGFKSFRRGVNLNTWLFRNGYIALKDGKQESGEWFCDVDWPRTRAYALGLGGIYLNARGREAKGTVDPGNEASILRKEIANRLLALEDQEGGGEKPIRRMYDREEIFSGPYRENCPDLIVGYAEGYRASWDSVKGVVGTAVIEDNVKAWSGDHCIDPEIVPGVLFSSRALNTDNPSIVDIAPTALALFGVDIPKHMDGRPIIDTDILSSAQKTNSCAQNRVPRGQCPRGRAVHVELHIGKTWCR